MNGDITVNQVTSEEYLVTVDSALSQETIVTVETVVPEAFNIITEGIQGPPGASGIDGYPVSVVLPGDGDLLTFNANNSIWTNVNRTSVSDGGNF